MPLPLYDFIAVQGERAVEFLQSQLSCDLRGASPGRALSGAWCSIKGRVITSLLLRVPEAGPVLLRLRSDLATDTAGGLGRYAALSRVKLMPGTGLTCIGVHGSNARDTLRHALGAAPAAQFDIVAADADALVLQRDDGGRMFEVWVPQASSDTITAALSRHAAPASAGDWLLALIGAGIAEIQSRTRDQFLPQVLGYDTDGTVSFRKGCYPGQEVVARAHYKGAVKRHLALLHGERGPCPEPGAALLAGERTAGTIVEAAADRQGRIAVLAVLSQDPAQEPLLTREGLELRPAVSDPML